MADSNDRQLTTEEQSCITEFERRLREVGSKRFAILDNSSWHITPEIRSALTLNDLEYKKVFEWLRTAMPAAA